MLPRDSQAIERCKTSRPVPRFQIQFRPNASDEFSPLAFGGNHPGQKKQLARLYRFHVDAERFGRRRELYAKFLQPLLGAGRPRAFAGYHLPACAPSFTCKTSSVVNVASSSRKQNCVDEFSDCTHSANRAQKYVGTRVAICKPPFCDN